MSQSELKIVDLNIFAENGLKRGFTTGSCATAGLKAALTLLQDDLVLSQVAVTLPDGEHFLSIPVQSVEKISSTSARATVIKNAGDDPDCTDGATITVEVTENSSGQIVFKAGDGVGMVTEPGIRVPVGEPAINPGPRQMMTMAVQEVFADDRHPGCDITVGCVNGLALAKKTFNPRLGITGGISILGTTGVVEPMSLAAYMAAIEVYIRVSAADNTGAIAFLPGNIGLKYCHDKLGLPRKQIVNISNFLGFSLETLDAILSETPATERVKTLYLLGHPGKIAKVLGDQYDLHSSRSSMAMGALARFWQRFDLRASLLKAIENANTVEAIVELLGQEPSGKRLWHSVEIELARLVKERLSSIQSVEVRLFNMRGQALSDSDCTGVTHG
ncbi:MAG: cobalt-precorrin-5B (C(1))-methyltransferase CbiD [Candidatus Obscuribacterales bacterium]|nr:cobalt-precorrin-5B (C(1))-methyltransferase CbiD [Candidatus Obscuribacterales bacterium]